MRIVGLTGGIASGKSTVSRELEARGVPIIDADKIAFDALKKGSFGWRRVVAVFGPEILLENGEVNRAHLGEIIFADPTKRKDINRALEPSIAAGVFVQIAKHWIYGTPVVVLDAPLLFEAKITWVTKPVVVVWVDNPTQECRLLERDKLSREQAHNRINAQLSLEWKRDRADVVIDNSGSLEATRDQVNHLWATITAQPSWKEYLSSRSGVASTLGVIFFGWCFSYFLS